MTRMKRITAAVCAAVMVCGAVGCSKNSESTPKNNAETNAQGQSVPGDTKLPDEKEASGQNSDTPAGTELSGLQLLTQNSIVAVRSSCINENGFYYITDNTAQLKDGSYAYHLMYMDFASQQEIYLCSSPGCSHDTATCTSVLSADEFEYDSRVFYYDNALYVLSREYDQDGTISTGLFIGGDEVTPAASSAAALYRMNPDGTDRTKVYEFEADLTVEEMVLGSGTDLYFVVKKISTEQVNGSSFASSSQRRLVRLDTLSWKCQTVYQFEKAETDTDWNIIGCFDTSLVLSSYSFDHVLSNEERLDDDASKENYKNAKVQIGILNLSDGTLNVVRSFRNDLYPNFSYGQKGEMLYISEENCLKQINLKTGEEKTLAQLEQSLIWGVYDDVVCCRLGNLREDYTLYFVNIKDGSISHCGLTNRSLGWALELCGETSDKFLVIYDYDAVPNGDDSYSIKQYWYALIAKEDLYNGIGNYLPIQMISKGA